MIIEALKNIDPEAIPRRGTETKPLIEALAKGPVAFAAPEDPAPTVRRVIMNAVRAKWEGKTARVAIKDGTVYVQVVERRPRKPRTVGAKRGRKPKAATE